MQVTVKHMERDEITGDVIGFTPVAIVDASDFVNHGIEEALNYAFRYTNNINGSWSIQKEFLDTRSGGLFENGDYNEDVTVLVEREDGLGLRSTSMGDRMEVDGVEYRVAMVGFKEVA